MTHTWLDFDKTLNKDNSPRSIAESAIYPLPERQQITIEGKDASKFLQGQLSCDINQITPEQSLMGSHNTAKGRMISSFRVFRQANERYTLVMDSSISDQALAALKKYIVFSKAEIAIDENQVVVGCHGAKARENLKALFSTLPDHPMEQVISDGRVLICTDAELPAYEIYLSADQAINIWPTISQSLPVLNENQQRLTEHKNGLGFINDKTTELFIAQMLNYQAISAISFDKGCYTGQEIIARMKYLGKLKRHMYHYRAKSDFPIESGASISLESGSKNIGNIVSAVVMGKNIWDLLLVLTDEAATQSELFIDKNPLTEIEKITLPYLVDDLDLAADP